MLMRPLPTLFVVFSSLSEALSSSCSDSPTFTFGTYGLFETTVRDCSWITKNPLKTQNRITNWCDQTYAGKLIRDECPTSCEGITCSPSSSPTISQMPSLGPKPSIFPTRPPSPAPSPFPTARPSSSPSTSPSDSPSIHVSDSPSIYPSQSPSEIPSVSPSLKPSSIPSTHPSSKPSKEPSLFPSTIPTSYPSEIPSEYPSPRPSTTPSAKPSTKPSSLPTASPTSQPSLMPSSVPSDEPTTTPTSTPSLTPSAVPSEDPTNTPTESIKPSPSPSASPTVPTLSPSEAPSTTPTVPICSDTKGRFGIMANDRIVLRTCAWVNKQDTIRRCQLEGVAKACPVSCDNCSPEPSAAPSVLSESPSKAPTTSPPTNTPTTEPPTFIVTTITSSPSTNCVDSELRLRFVLNGMIVSRYCSWVKKKKTKLRCSIENIAAACPLTCGSCNDCVDPGPSLQFKFIHEDKELRKSCNYVKRIPSKKKGRCRSSANICRATCGVC